MEEEEMIFDPSLKKKKKKKKTPFEFEAAASGENAAPEAPETAASAEGDASAPANKDENEPAADDFSGMKKKKKKPASAPAAPGEGETEDGDQLKKNMEKLNLNEPAVHDEGMDEDFDFSQKKKPKKDKKVVISDAPEVLGEEPVEIKPSQPIAIKEGDYSHTDRDYTYEELLNRVFNIMKEKNPEMVSGERKKFVMKPPQVSRLGTKKTAFANFAEICKLLHRQPKHLLAFMLAELGTSGSVDGSNSLIIKGRFQQKQIESVLRRYIKEYVTCHTCRSPETNLERDTRLFFLQCMTCGSRCSVASIKSGFQALTGKRAAMRAKEA